MKLMKMSLGVLLASMLLASPSPCYASLIHLYEFTSDAADSVGGANGTLMNGASVSGGVLNLDGVDDFVQFGMHLVPTSGSYSVAMFIRDTAPQSSYTELISEGCSCPGFYIGTGADGSVTRASDQWNSTGVSLPSDGLFHHVALTVDAGAGNSKLYLDGSLAATLGLAIAAGAGGTDTRFGSQFSSFGEYFKGSMADVRIYDNALSAEGVAALATPEPSSLLLCASGLVALARARRKKKAIAQDGPTISQYDGVRPHCTNIT